MGNQYGSCCKEESDDLQDSLMKDKKNVESKGRTIMGQNAMNTGDKFDDDNRYLTTSVD